MADPDEERTQQPRWFQDPWYQVRWSTLFEIEWNKCHAAIARQRPGADSAAWRDVFDELTDHDDFRAWRMVYRAYVNCDDVLHRLQMRLQRYRHLVHIRDGYDYLSDDSDLSEGISWNSYDETDVLHWQVELMMAFGDANQAEHHEEQTTPQ